MRAVNSETQNHSAPSVLYDVAMNRLQAQIEQIDAIDAKLGAILSFASVILTIFAGFMALGDLEQPLYALVLSGLAFAAYLALMVFSIYGYRLIKWHFRPDLSTLQEHCQSFDDSVIKEWVASECIQSWKDNSSKIKSKAKCANIAVYLLATEVILLILTFLLPLLLN